MPAIGGDNMSLFGNMALALAIIPGARQQWRQRKMYSARGLAQDLRICRPKVRTRSAPTGRADTSDTDGHIN
jgi:hypothetical protein